MQSLQSVLSVPRIVCHVRRHVASCDGEIWLCFPELLGCGSELKLFGVPSENLPVFGCWRRSKAMTEKGFRIASQATWFVQEWRRGFLREFLLF